MDAVDWAPAEVVRSEKVREALESVALAWSEAWFVQRRMNVSRLEAVNRATLKQLALSGSTPHGAVRVATTGRSDHRLAGWALGVNASTQGKTDADRALFDAIEAAMLADLAQRMETAASPPNEAAPMGVDALTAHGGAILKLTGEDGADVVSAALPMAILARLSRRPSRGRARHQPALASRTAAAGAVPLRLEAIIGSAQVPVGDLRQLARGDVLVLDRRLDDPIDLRLPGAEAPLARAELRSGDQGATLTIHSDSKV